MIFCFPSSCIHSKNVDNNELTFDDYAHFDVDEQETYIPGKLIPHPDKDFNASKALFGKDIAKQSQQKTLDNSFVRPIPTGLKPDKNDCYSMPTKGKRSFESKQHSRFRSFASAEEILRVQKLLLDIVKEECLI